VRRELGRSTEPRDYERVAGGELSEHTRWSWALSVFAPPATSSPSPHPPQRWRYDHGRRCRRQAPRRRSDGEADRIARWRPLYVVALPLRAAAATVFWNSAQAKLANWDTTIELSPDDYNVPLPLPEIAANLALGIELTMPVLLVLGLLTRAAALVLLGMPR
jgi:DoxX